MIKVHIQTVCEFCDGEAYVPIGPDVDYNGEPFIRHQPYGARGDSSGSSPACWECTFHLEHFASLFQLSA
jgi:hypothetical protein